MTDLLKKRKIDIIYEDNHLLIVNKPAGILSQGDKTGDESIIDWGKTYIKAKYNKPGNVFLGLVHRLDRPVSGALVLAKTSKALERMNQIFQERRVEKTYWALTRLSPEDSDTLLHWMKKDRSTNTSKAYKKQVSGTKKAELSYALMGRIGDMYLLKVSPMTGRSHQIRVQLATSGLPIVGDVKYGRNEKPNSDGSICLHSRELQFIHPVKKEELRVTAKLPGLTVWKQFIEFE